MKTTGCGVEPGVTVNPNFVLLKMEATVGESASYNITVCLRNDKNTF